MSEEVLEERSPEKFEKVMEGFITCEQAEVPTATFFKALAHIDSE